VHTYIVYPSVVNHEAKSRCLLMVFYAKKANGGCLFGFGEIVGGFSDTLELFFALEV
jgi:hypothetical protein